MGKVILYLFGICWVVVGVLSIFATDLIKKKFFDKVMKISNLKKMSPVAFAAGILLVYAAPSSRFGIFVTLLGLLAIIKGILAIVATEKMDKIRNWCLKQDNTVYKIMGVIILVLGSFVLIGIK